MNVQPLIDTIASQLLPGWQVRAVQQDRAAMDRLIPRSLAVCHPLPERQIATVYVVDPWPESESLSETLWHELTHAALSPITAQLGEHPGAIMLEEQIVERIGTLLSRATPRARRGIAAALRRAPASLRARLPRASLQIQAHDSRASGEPETMLNPEMVKGALDAIESGNAQKAIEILKGLIASAASGEEPEGSDVEPMSERSEALAKKAEPGMSHDGMKAEPDPGMYGRRARVLHDELAAMARDAREGAKSRLIDSLRARLGDSRGLPALEKRIAAAADYQAAKAIHDIAIELSPAAEQAPVEGLRARAERQTAAPVAPSVVEPSDLASFDSSFVAEYRRLARTDAAAADYWMRAGRARLARDAARGGN